MDHFVVKEKVDDIDKIVGESDKQSFVGSFEKTSSDLNFNETNNCEFQIFIKMSNGTTIRLFVKKTDKICKVFRMIEATFDDNETVEDRTLSYGSTLLEEDRTVESYKIHTGSTLFMNGIIVGEVDGFKFMRLHHLFTNVIRGLPNHDALRAQMNELTNCVTDSDLKEYERQYPAHVL